MSNKIIRLPDVIKKTCLSRSSIYLRLKNNDFPKSISLGGRAIAWLEIDIDQWLDEKISKAKSIQSKG